MQRSYIPELKRLAEDCEFGEFLKQILRDRIVCGINNSRIQRRLLAERESYQSAFELAQSMETADLKILVLVQKWSGRTKCGSQKWSGPTKNGPA